MPARAQVVDKRWSHEDLSVRDVQSCAICIVAHIKTTICETADLGVEAVADSVGLIQADDSETNLGTLIRVAKLRKWCHELRVRVLAILKASWWHKLGNCGVVSSSRHKFLDLNAISNALRTHAHATAAHVVDITHADIGLEPLV